MKLRDYLLLPEELTPFERDYLERTNRRALGFFALHVPVFAVVAWLNGTGPALAAALTALAVAGPWLATRVLPNPRHVSVTFGITAMYVGALLVHFGRGLWTIEMHFYFFVALALLAVFANPAVILAAAATVTVHHAALWWWLPESVFNYDAPFASVAIHALFVVLESAAACYVARGFFDNVIGLEQIVGQRTRELDRRNRDIELIFDNIAQGFFTVTPDGRLARGHSRVLDDWFGPPAPGQTLWGYFAAIDETFSEWLRLGWESLAEDVLPVELVLAQLPTRLTHAERSYQLTCRRIVGESGAPLFLVVVDDVTERRAREQADEAHRELAVIAGHLARDRQGVLDFMDEADALLSVLDPASPVIARRIVHTLKGNAAMFGLTRVARACEAAEQAWALDDQPIDSSKAAIHAAWAASTAALAPMLGGARHGVLEVEEGELLLVLRAIEDGLPREMIRDLVTRWRDEPTRHRLARFGEQARALAERLGRAPLEVVIEHGQLRLPREPLGPFWSALVHVVRNAVDHGLRQVEAPRLALSSEVVDGRIVISVADNGAGIDWDAVRARATRLGLPCETAQELQDALFADGLTTRDEASETSGRGVGLAAVRQACRAMGVEITVSTAPSGGTRFAFALPPEAPFSCPPMAA